jgi:hypothetical protein
VPRARKVLKEMLVLKALLVRRELRVLLALALQTFLKCKFLVRKNYGYIYKENT